MTRRLGVLGGTFDPVHFGHLDAAGAARSALALTDVLFVPSYDPPHRSVDPRATAFHRFAMLALATNGCPQYRVSDVELARKGHSYTADTLRSLQAAGWQRWQLFFILGADAFAEIATWHEFPDVLDAAHFIVVARPGTTLDRAVARTPDLRGRARSVSEYVEDGGPGLFLIEADTRDISSTVIRQRLAAGQPIDDLVPSAVARHIAAHHLYRMDIDLHGSDTNNHRA
ncbi:MAG TPA: nicotinate-nucleotide adenylyltransferase [Vicinamibacterales bacterium]